MVPLVATSFWASVQGTYLLKGALVTLEVSFGALALALLAGLPLALLRMARLPPLRAIASMFVWVMRGTPLLLQLVFLYDILPKVGLALSAVLTAIIGFGINETAFVGEIVRGGLLGVHSSQKDAADSLGMSPWVKLRRIVLPQALKAILPSLGNESISLLKATSLGSVIALNELTLRSEEVVSVKFNFYQVFGVAGAMYLVMTSLLALIQRQLERRFSFQASPGGASRVLLRGLDPAHVRGALGHVLRARVPRMTGTHMAVTTRSGKSQPPGAAGNQPAAPGVSGNGTSAGSGLPARTTDRWPGAAAVRPDACFLEVKDVWKTYKGQADAVLRGVSLAVGYGEVVVIMGASGSGKSTLLKLISHLEEIDRGEILLQGEHIGYERKRGKLRSVRRVDRARAEARIGMVFQHFNLFEHMSALQNVTAAPTFVHNVAWSDAEREALEHLERVGLAAKASSRPQQLSGGQQQRVAIARALAIRPRLILFDEPTSALDPELVGEVLAAIRALASAGLTMIVVTHEVRFARDVADRVVFMENGVIVEEGPPSEVLVDPKHISTRRFLNLITEDA